MKIKTNSLTTTIAFGAIGIFLIGGVLVLNKGPHLNELQQTKARADNLPTALSDLLEKPVPQFSLRDRGGVEYSSENLKGKNVVLFFNEGLMCYPSCWNQIVALAQDKRFQNEDTVTLSVVTDNPNDWQRAVTKMPELGYAKVLFDSDRTVSRQLGMLTTNSSMHYGSLPGHSYILIDKQGIIRYVYDDPRMAINNNTVFDELQKLN